MDFRSFWPSSHLFTNHADAWIVTLGITIGALVIHQTFTFQALLLAFSITGGYWLAFAINDYYDAEIDRLDPVKSTKNYFTLHSIDQNVALRWFLISTLIIGPGFLQFGWYGALVVGISIFVMWAYSAPPLRVKTRPGLDLIMHMFFVETFPYAVMLYLLGLPWDRLDYVIIGLGLFASATAQIEQQLRDIEQDMLEDGKTFSIWVGPANALFILKGLSVGMICYGFYFTLDGTIPWIVLPIGLLALPAVLTRFFRHPNQPRPERLIRFSVLMLLFYVAALILYYLL